MKKRLVAAMLGIMMITMTGCSTQKQNTTVVETEVVTEVEEVTEEPTELVEETTEAVEEATEEETEVVVEATKEETEVVEEVSPYTYTELNQVMYAQSTVNVRDLPEQTGGKVGSLTTNQEVTVTGQCNETGWYRISFSGGEGFVSNSYLGSEKVASQSTASSAQSSTPAAQPAAEAPASTPAAEAPASGGDVWNGENMQPDNVSAAEAAADNTLTPDVQAGETCGYCGAVVNSYEEYVAHLETVHGLQ